ncbi:cysteine desulfurase [Neisseria bacilliformis ATCC BAA-1200]|uniref:Cysteine desulfurase n=1 Tax=Neisseria bacilliformis ATCC BAA-1200 TaxID=888742 RepID=F2B8Y8_9NEIS|nr:cysteine desulfurase [Neisseria bacilliformis ATCC BAA-1200]
MDFWVKRADLLDSRERVRRLGAAHPTLGSAWVGWNRPSEKLFFSDGLRR